MDVICKRCGVPFRRIVEGGRPRVNCFTCRPLRPLADVLCPCGEVFTPTGRGQRYCSPKCRSKAHAKPRGECSVCQGPLWLSPTSAPEGKRMCRPCRRANPWHQRNRTPCVQCGGVKGPRRSRYCEGCSKLTQQWKRRRRAEKWAHRYGPEHKKARAEYVERFTPGDACARCNEPMWDDPKDLDLDHTDDGTAYLGLSHRTCNRSKGKSPAGKPRYRTSFALRDCEECRQAYRPCTLGQRYCGMECVAVMRRRASAERQARRKSEREAAKPKHPCAECGDITTKPTYCSIACGSRRNARLAYRRKVGKPLDAPLDPRGQRIGWRARSSF
jgi:hypothetical protein